MPAPRRVPLAWRNLTHDWVRFALYTMGITFAVVLMGMQMGVLNALIDSNCRLIDHMRADLVMVHPNRASLFYHDGVSRRRLGQAAAVPGVAEVHPMYIDYRGTELEFTDPAVAERRPARTIRVVGFDPDAGLLDMPEVRPGSPGAMALRIPGNALFDVNAKPNPKRHGESVYGRVPNDGQSSGWTVQSELNGRSLTLVGGFPFGTDFVADGTLLVSDRTFLDYVRTPIYPFNPDATSDLGLVRVAPGSDPIEVRDRLRKEMGASPSDAGRDVEVFTVGEFRDREARYWLRVTPIGYAFGVGLVLGFVVGFVIVYQILSGDVADHLTEYATLRAIGYPGRYLSQLVIGESLTLALAGFVPGILITAGAYFTMEQITGLPMNLTIVRIAGLLFATVVMCIGSGLLALRKAKTVDPANVF
jgi:putative ABC transport system permease protein